MPKKDDWNYISRSRLIDVLEFEVNNNIDEILSVVEEQVSSALSEERWPGNPPDAEGNRDPKPPGIIALAQLMAQREMLIEMRRELEDNKRLFGMPLDVETPNSEPVED